MLGLLSRRTDWESLEGGGGVPGDRNVVLTLRITYIKENLGKIVTSRNFK